MSNTKNNGGPAFPDPAASSKYKNATTYSQGMTLRDYFAAKAMTMLMQEWPIAIFDNNAQDEVAKNCYAMADAMLKAREQ